MIKIVSGGQTGADRAALDWAIARGIDHDGWCPAGRKAEDGKISDRYHLRETGSGSYLVRTKWNVRDSDATVIFSIGPDLSGGSLATQRFARELGKPCLHLSAQGEPDPVAALVRFVDEFEIRVLNVAGPRASGEPGVGEFIWEVLDAALGAG